MNIQTITLGADKRVDIAIDEYGKRSSETYLLLHGGAGLQSMTGLAQRLAESEHAHVYVPTHPGFGGTSRPEWVDSIRVLAQIYVALIEQLDLQDVIVIGSSIGGWIAAEMALLHSPRIPKFILINAVGIEVEGQPIADVFSLTMDELAKLSYHNPAMFRIDADSLTDAQKHIMATNRQTLAVYSNPPFDPTLRNRLSAITSPTLILWGESDRIASSDYGRAYVKAIPNANFQLLANAGHLPQIETPDQTVIAIQHFAKHTTETVG